MQIAAGVFNPTLHPKFVEGEKLAARITELYAYITVAESRFLTLVREFDEKGYWELSGITCCAHWLNWQCGIGMNAAREKVRVARALGTLPKISKAFERGEVSYSKVRAMTRAATPKNEDYLLNIAHHGTAHHTERLIAHFRRVNRLQESATAEKQHRNREVFTRWGADGSLVVNARLPAEQGALLLKALELAMEQQLQEAKALVDERDWDAAGSTKPTRPEPARVPARRADALAEVAETYLAGNSASGSAADRYQVVVHVTAETLPSETPELSCLEDGPRVSAETSRRLACDGSIVPLVTDEEGEPLSIGRRSRAIPPAIRRALKIRDGGCRFPGCTHARFVDGHHIRHWADGGATSLGNLVLLCRRHHRLMHEGGFGCERDRNGRIVFRSPRGNVLPTCADVKPAAAANDVVAWIAQHHDCEHIDARTCVTRWTGERIDWPLAVEHLFPVQNDGGTRDYHRGHGP